MALSCSEPYIEPVRTHPFTVSEHDGRFSIQLGLTDSILSTYDSVFSRHGMSGNGYAWEVVIYEMLEEKEPKLLKHVTWNSEGGAFFAWVDDRKALDRFLTLVVPICNDLEQLEGFVKSIDPEDIE
jgi:hypothetical protein